MNVLLTVLTTQRDGFDKVYIKPLQLIANSTVSVLVLHLHHFTLV